MTTAKRSASDAGQTETQSSGVVPSRTGEGVWRELVTALLDDAEWLDRCAVNGEQAAPEFSEVARRIRAMVAQAQPPPEAVCAECGATLEQIGPDKFQHPSCSQSVRGESTALSGSHPAAVATRALARHVLEHADKFSWSLQGMGMLRLHLSDNVRLHVWDSRFRVPGVSMIHDHLQWALHSTIVSGRLTNRRYRMVGNGVGGLPFRYTVLKPGYGCYHKTEPQTAKLLALKPEVYGPGESYSQRPDEIHETDALDGTVTVMSKSPTDDESARVFWPEGTEWGSAEPRPATAEEVAAITQHALKVWA